MQKKIVKLALIGNPNVGKTSLFNKLTGLNQKVGNYIGVTVDKKIGYFFYENIHYQIIDLPGTYSIYPSSDDEEIVNKLLIKNKYYSDYPDKIIIIADSSNLKKNLLLLLQIKDLGYPVLFVLNMLDEAKKKGIVININKLKKLLSTDIVLINAREGIGLNNIKKKLKYIKKNSENSYTEAQEKNRKYFFNFKLYYPYAIKEIKDNYKISDYKAWIYLASNDNFSKNDTFLKNIKKKYKIISKRLQVKETISRYEIIQKILYKTVSHNISNKEKKYLEFYKKIDNNFILHPIFGYIIFFSFIFIIFQCVFFGADFSEKYIDILFNIINNKISSIWDGPLNNLLLQGILPGIQTIITFIPQILILLFFISFMEESGYISRVIFLMDRIMRPFGLNGKSVVPIISSMACAIPAIISSRHIENTRDRLITILITPFITCSARLPVYTLIISLVIPDKKWYFFKLRGLVLMGMYLIGFISSLIIAFILNNIIKKNYKSHLILEIPTYKIPMLKNIFISLFVYIKSFVYNIGRIIILVNIIIWSLGTFGPTQNYIMQSKSIENSYLGILGKKIEPVIKPLGFDWKIGVGILSSLIAREVFVSTMNSIYEIEKKGDILIDKMTKDINPEDNKPIYNLATGMSLLFFYAFSMQCISTLSIIKKETKSWKWPVIQIILMTLLAYLSSFIIYQLFI